MLTIFSTCKPFVREFKIIQTNAIKSWARLGKEVEIILFGDEEGVKDICSELQIKHIEKIERNKMGTPYLDYIFKEVLKVASNNILCYVNADIIFLPEFIDVVKFIKDRIKKFLVVGKRWDVEIKELIDYSDPDWYVKLKQFAINNGKYAAARWLDYFVYTRDLYRNIPPFLVGRTWWDTYLMSNALVRTLNVFDATEVIFAIHQNHSYKHHRQLGYGVYKGEEAQYNRRLAKNTYLSSSLGNARRAFFKITKDNNTFKIKLNFIGWIRNVFAFIKGLGIR